MNADWRVDALCAQVGGDVFFPDKGGDSLAAKRICGDCPVRAECLAYALDWPGEQPQGIWGGLGARARERVKARQRREAAA